MVKFLLKERGFTINGVKKILNDPNADYLDENVNLSVYKPDLQTTKMIKSKLKKISKILKDLKDYK